MLGIWYAGASIPVLLDDSDGATSYGSLLKAASWEVCPRVDVFQLSYSQPLADRNEGISYYLFAVTYNLLINVGPTCTN